jgi:hypothetical protein
LSSRGGRPHRSRAMMVNTTAECIQPFDNNKLSFVLVMGYALIQARA